MAYIDENDIYKIFENGKGQGIERIHVAQIDELPRADVAPVIHGERIETTDIDGIVTQRCSVCQKIRYGKCKTNYCSVCGAKMDGKVSE